MEARGTDSGWRFGERGSQLTFYQLGESGCSAVSPPSAARVSQGISAENGLSSQHGAVYHFKRKIFSNAIIKKAQLSLTTSVVLRQASRGLPKISEAYA